MSLKQRPHVGGSYGTEACVLPPPPPPARRLPWPAPPLLPAAAAGAMSHARAPVPQAPRAAASRCRAQRVVDDDGCTDDGDSGQIRLRVAATTTSDALRRHERNTRVRRDGDTARCCAARAE
jgi:hypothetical protein